MHLPLRKTCFLPNIGSWSTLLFFTEVTFETPECPIDTKMKCMPYMSKQISPKTFYNRLFTDITSETYLWKVCTRRYVKENFIILFMQNIHIFRRFNIFISHLIYYYRHLQKVFVSQFFVNFDIRFFLWIISYLLTHSLERINFILL